MKLEIELQDNHVEICKTWASMRRTLTEAAQLLEKATIDKHEPTDEDYCVAEIQCIMATVEALQFAVRDGKVV